MRDSRCRAQSTAYWQLHDCMIEHSPETLPQLLEEKALRWGDRRAAIREKEFGIWQAYTWRQYADHVQRIALGLAALGFRRGVIGELAQLLKKPL